LLLSSETILTTELRISKEPHSGPAPPQLLNKSEAVKHHKTNDCSFVNSFIGKLPITPHSLAASDRLAMLAILTGNALS
jgi:hypothetical protein